MRHWSASLGLALGVLSPHAAWAAPQDAIVVTGEKRAVPLQDTSVSIAVLTAEEIARGLDDLQDVNDRVANLTDTFHTSGFSIRGISNVGVSGAGEAATATVYLDGVPLASTYLQAAPTRLWDVAQVEVLRGPQSTIQGLNSLAGAIVIRTADPRLDRTEGRFRAFASDEPAHEVALAASVPLVRNQLALRYAVEALDRDGFIRNVTRGTGEDRESRSAHRLKLRWEPASLPGLAARLGFLHAARDGGFYNVYARTDLPDFFDRPIATDNTPNTTRLRFDAASLELRYAAADGFDLTSASSWSEAIEHSSYDTDYGPLNEGFASSRRAYRTVTQEMRLDVDRGPLTGVLGLFFHDRDLASRTVSRTNVPTPVPTIAALLRGAGLNPALAGIIAASYGAALPFITVDFDGSFPTKVQSLALFGDGRLRVTRRLSVLAGFRLDRETNQTQNTQESAFAGSLPNPAAFGALGPVIAQINGAVLGFVAQSNAALPRSRRRFETFLPKGGLRMDWTERLATSFVIQRGYRSGGSSTNIARGQSVPYDPEYIWNYELSLRSLWLDGKLRLNANAYYMDWRDQQVSVNFGLNAFDVHTVNAGKSHLYGFEIEADARISQEWRAYASLGHQRTRFERFAIQQTGMVSNLAGTEFAFAPAWTIAGGASFQPVRGIAASLDAKFTSRAFGIVGPGQGLSPVKAHTIINARLGYRTRHWSLTLVARNLLDERHIVYKSPAETRAVLNHPRSFGLEFRAEL